MSRCLCTDHWSICFDVVEGRSVSTWRLCLLSFRAGRSMSRVPMTIRSVKLIGVDVSSPHGSVFGSHRASFGSFGLCNSGWNVSVSCSLATFVGASKHTFIEEPRAGQECDGCDWCGVRTSQHGGGLSRPAFRQFRYGSGGLWIIALTVAVEISWSHTFRLSPNGLHKLRKMRSGMCHNGP